MHLSVYSRAHNTEETIDTFLESYYSSQMKYLASDLLKKGLSYEQISSAITKAIKIATISDLKTCQHFKPVYSAIDNQIIKDCKLSDLGYGLVLLNADVNVAVVADFQINILNFFFNNK
jgi:hypothetical protein